MGKGDFDLLFSEEGEAYQERKPIPWNGLVPQLTRVTNFVQQRSKLVVSLAEPGSLPLRDAGSSVKARPKAELRQPAIQHLLPLGSCRTSEHQERLGLGSDLGHHEQVPLVTFGSRRLPPFEPIRLPLVDDTPLGKVQEAYMNPILRKRWVSCPQVLVVLPPVCGFEAE